MRAYFYAPVTFWSIYSDVSENDGNVDDEKRFKEMKELLGKTLKEAAMPTRMETPLTAAGGLAPNSFLDFPSIKVRKEAAPPINAQKKLEISRRN